MKLVKQIVSRHFFLHVSIFHDKFFKFGIFVSILPYFSLRENIRGELIDNIGIWMRRLLGLVDS